MTTILSSTHFQVNQFPTVEAAVAEALRVFPNTTNWAHGVNEEGVLLTRISTEDTGLKGSV